MVKLGFKVVDELEHELLKQDAHAHNMNVSEYLRWLIEKERREKGGFKGGVGYEEV